MIKFLKSKKGFTLVELMVVVVILGVLVAIAIPIYNDITGDARKNACASNIKIIRSALQQAKANGVDMSKIKDVADLKNAGYIDEEVKCPVDNDAAYNISNGEVTHITH